MKGKLKNVSQIHVYYVVMKPYKKNKQISHCCKTINQFEKSELQSNQIPHICMQLIPTCHTYSCKL